VGAGTFSRTTQLALDQLLHLRGGPEAGGAQQGQFEIMISGEARFSQSGEENRCRASLPHVSGYGHRTYLLDLSKAVIDGFRGSFSVF